ncbi:protein translocase subunit secF [Desulfonispora thiosulfatigenes DSM 11270]|uniref:Protein-export membrane protein SecF n=1 Tax=Desulfonispora thiosulfatigenes DSM 11270 TaxID=656914 RepID=A0A1W1VQS4_DESTI|nr:protein translocase subunit SecF [Desulfonispora thiosulfatigenes]SMB95697.1 protein translocase subunit secF [Desulfonispora thiosulfatigenes DSM 11270]
MDFIGKRKIPFTVSAIIIIVSLLSLFINGLNFGIDFIGGNTLSVQFGEQTSTKNIRESLKAFDLDDAQIQGSDNNIFVIKTKESLEESKLAEIKTKLQDDIGKMEVLSSEKVGPVIGKELRKNGILSLVIAIILMVIYITIRFEFKFALAAIIALIHDVLFTVGIFSLFKIEVDITFIAAILTIIGYSINDTIVIFDRIRENLRIVKKESLEKITNDSIIQTLSRSINTVLTTLFTLVALFVLGGATTKIFALTLIIGISIGAYSSIFIASPCWFEFKGLKK